MTTVVLADDHPVVLQGLRALLEREPGIEVVGLATTGPEALQLIGQRKPDIAVVDLMMPSLNGIEVARQAAKRSPATRVLVLSMYAMESYVVETLRSGAFGYVLKDSSDVDLVRAVRDVAAGRRYLSPPLSERALAAYLERAGTGTLDPLDMLSNREREVLQLAAEGHSNADIAGRLQISPRTAETHRANLMRKLGLHGQAELIRYSLRRGILPPA